MPHRYVSMTTWPLPLDHAPLQPPAAKESWHVKGALDVVLKQCATLPDGSPLTSVDKEHYHSAAHDLGLKGLRGQRLRFEVGVSLIVHLRFQLLPWQLVRSWGSWLLWVWLACGTLPVPG